MTRTLEDVTGLTAADIMHRHITTLDASATVGEVRAYFAASGSRRLGLLADGERYAGAILAEGFALGADSGEPAAEHVTAVPTVTPETSAVEARDLALGLDSRRLPVVDEQGRLVGIVAIATARTHFCGT